jgi:5-methylcytosine-specific restriction endonuclease McrA
MIPVALAKEPPEFDAKVRQPGLSAIAELVGRQPRLKRRGPKRKKLADKEQDIPADEFPPYWREALPEMLVAYERRCAYLAMYIHHATGNPTVDHVLPKSYAWNQVYEWANYRLCAAIINSKKGALLTLADPFSIGPGWFVLNLNTLHVERGDVAPEAEWNRIDATLPVLNHRLCVQEREEYVRCYRLGPGAGGFDLAHLEYRAPFIASELRRQGQLVRGDT